MRNWLIYEPPGGARPTLDGAEGFVSLREGFSKRAFVFAPFWLAFRRCWLALGIYVVAEVALLVAAWAFDLRAGSGFTLLLLPNLAVGFEAAWLRARSLERRGYTLAGGVVAREREEAELAFFQDWLAGAAAPAAPREIGGAPAPYRPPVAGVLGLFPEPGAAR
jgi:hypothetical protein